MGFPDPIRVDGLRELRRNLRRVSSTAPRGIRVASNAAAELIVNRAKPRVPLGPGRGGHAKSSIKAASTGTAARVSEGGKRFPYMPFLDFGGHVGPGGSVYRRYIKEGRYIWAAFAELRPQIEATLERELNEVARSAGLGGS